MDIPEKEELGALESLESRLYDPKGKIEEPTLHHVRDRKEKELPTSWGDDTPILRETDGEAGLSFGTKFLIGAIILLLFVLGFTAWRVFTNRNVVSEKNIDMLLDVSPYVDGGETLPLTVNLTNNNKVALEEASLTLSYKQGNSAQDEEEKIQQKESLGTIAPGEFKHQDFSIELYGGEAESRDITVKLDYKVNGLKAPSKIGIAKVVLKTSPLSVQIKGPQTLSVGQTGTYVVTVYNPTATTSQAALLMLTLPTNFKILSQSPAPLSERNQAWPLAPISPGATTTFTIKGSLQGNQGETGTLKAIVGSRGSSIGNVGVVYASTIFDISLRTSPLSASVLLSTLRNAGETLIYGDTPTIEISYKNTSNEPLRDVKFVLSIDGNASIAKGVDTEHGYYDSVQRTITWDAATNPELALIEQGKFGTFYVTIPIVSSGSNSPKLELSLSGKGTAVTKDDVTVDISKSYVVQGSASLSATTHYKNSPFKNVGPIPPEVNVDTGYTLHFSVSAQNALQNATVSFVLPAYVTWANLKTSGANISYNSTTRTVTWSIGSLDAGKTVSADIGVTARPSQIHLGSTPYLTSGIVFNADEVASKAHIRTTVSGLTTYLEGESWSVEPSKVVDP